MVSGLFNTLLYQPFYNGLIFFITHVPGGDVGVAIILLTIAVKFLLFLLSYRSTKSQAILREKMADVEPDLAALKEKYKDNRQELATKTLELYRKHNINPFAGFAGIIALLLQIPVILALYFVFLQGGLPVVDNALLYPFLRVTGDINMISLGIIDVAAKSIPLAILTGFTQFLHARLTMPRKKKEKKEATTSTPNIKDDLVQSMQFNMTYIFPLLVGFFAYSLSAAVAIYWITSNIFAIGQDLLVKKHLERETKQYGHSPH